MESSLKWIHCFSLVLLNVSKGCFITFNLQIHSHILSDFSCYSWSFMVDIASSVNKWVYFNTLILYSEVFLKHLLVLETWNFLQSQSCHLKRRELISLIYYLLLISNLLTLIYFIARTSYTILNGSATFSLSQKENLYILIK